MKWFKRTFLSVVRKPTQAILMFIIVFVLGNVLFASIAIKQASADVRQEMFNRAPSYLHLEKNDFIGEVKFEDVVKFARSRSKRMVSVVRTTLKTIVPNTNNGLFFNPHLLYEVKDMSFRGISSVQDSVYKYTFTEGGFFTQEDIDQGNPKIILSEWEASQDGKALHVGDTYTVYLYDYIIDESNVIHDQYLEPVKYEFEIAGIYSKKRIDSRYLMSEIHDSYFEIPEICAMRIKEAQQQVLNSHSTADQLIFDALHPAGDYTPKTELVYVYLEMQGIEKASDVQDLLLHKKSLPRYLYTAKTSVEDFRHIQAPLENLLALSNITLTASVVLVVVLLGLVSILFIRNRKNEVGILMALGERKTKVLSQFICEIVFVGLLATGFSMISGNKLANVISTEFLRIQVDVDSEIEYQSENPSAFTQLNLLDAYEVELDMKYIFTIYASSTFVLMLSSAAPVIYVLNIRPKNVLM